MKAILLIMAVALIFGGCAIPAEQPESTACSEHIKDYMERTVDLYGDSNETYLLDDGTFVTVFVHVHEDGSLQYTYFEYSRSGGDCVAIYSHDDTAEPYIHPRNNDNG